SRARRGAKDDNHSRYSSPVLLPPLNNQAISIQSTVASTTEFETTLFDIYLGDKFKGAVLADYTDDWLRVSEPEEVVSQLKEVKEADRLLPLLTGVIQKRRELPEIGAITYDLNNFRLIIEPGASLMESTNLALKRRVAPDPKAGFSLQQRLSATASGDFSHPSRSAFGHRSIASYGQFFGVIDGAVVSDRAYEVTEGTAGGIFGDYRGRAGFLQTSGTQFAPSLQYLGLNFETAEELFLDQDLIRGSRLEVFIPNRSRVEFYRDSRLLAVQVLDFGLQEIDTTAFPQGSYDIDIVITDSFGVVTRERRFFAKSGYLASRARPIYTLQVGSIRDDFRSLDIPVYQTGIRWRAADIFDLQGSVYGSESLHIGTISSNLFYRSYLLTLGVDFSSEGDLGASSSIGGSVFGTNINLGLAKSVRGGTPPQIVPTPDPNDPFAPVFGLRNRRTDLTFQERYDLSGSVGQTFGKVDVRVNGIRSLSAQSAETPYTYSVGPTLDWRITTTTDRSVRFSSAYAHTERGDIYTTGLFGSYRLTKNLMISPQIGWRRDNGENQLIAFIGLDYDNKDRNQVGTRGKFSVDLESSRDSSGETITSESNQLDIDHTGSYLQTVGFLRQSITSEQANNSMGLSATSSFLVARDGAVSLAHPVTAEGVLVAEVPSSSSKTEFEVLLDGQVAATVESGGRAVIGVAPYRSYKVRVRPSEGSDIVTYDTSTVEMTFFPGNVIHHKWQVERVFIILGRLVDEDGKPLPRQRIKGPKEYTATENDGTFQAEISGLESLEVSSSLRHCKLEINIAERPDYFVDLGDVTCRTVK
ncbi:MAG: hypothetical protein EBZ48_01420, partial [Proteobacteria bacterium]|nr:hypothetical protein [Pseudomonadota bacterium]